MLKTGGNFNITITACGEVYSWGYNKYGQLGLGNNDNQNNPQLVEFFKDKPSSMLQQANLQIIKIKCGDYHTFAITDIGEVYSWGRNDFGQLGLGHQIHQNIPQLVDFFRDKQINNIICGGIHTIAITDIGEVYSWGYGRYGQLGLGCYSNQNIPQLVEFFKDKQIKEIKCGDNHTIAITEIGEVYSWGDNDEGQLGLGCNNNQIIPQLIEFFNDKPVKKIKCGDSHTIAITEIGEVYSWGENFDGQLGLGPQRESLILELSSSELRENDESFFEGPQSQWNQNIPQLVEFFKYKPSCMHQQANLQIKEIKCGGYHTITITENGEVYSWGSNGLGQLGLGNYDNHNIPQQVEFFKDKQIEKIKCGYYHTIAITESGDVYSWGLNNSGELGLGNYDDHNVPQQVYFFKKHQIRTRISNIKSARNISNM